MGVFNIRIQHLLSQPPAPTSIGINRANYAEVWSFAVLRSASQTRDDGSCLRTLKLLVRHSSLIKL